MISRIRQRFGGYGLFVGLLLLLCAFLVWPILLTVQGGFVNQDGQFTVQYIISVCTDPLLREGLFNSLAIGLCTTLLCVLITLPLGLLAARCDFAGKALVTNLVLVPLILPPFVGAIGLRALLGRFGSFNALLGESGLLDPAGPGLDFLGQGLPGGGGRFWAVVVMEVLHLYPILYLNITAALANLDPVLEEAAANLGAGWWRRFFRCTLPLILPGLFAGSTIVFIWSFTELGTPLMFDYHTVMPVQIFWGINEVADNPRPYALVVVMLTVALGVYVLGRYFFGGHAYEMHAKASVASTARRLAGARAFAAFGLFAGITLVAVLPHLGVVFSSFSVEGSWYRSVLPQEWTLSHYQNALSHELAMQAIANSLYYASIAVGLCLIVGLAIAYLVVRVRLKGAMLLDGLAMLPLAVPGLVMAFGYVAMSLRWPFGPGDPLHRLASTLGLDPIGVLGQSPNPIPLIIIAYAVRRLPYIVRTSVAGLEQTSGVLEEAAMNLGASTLTCIRRIVIPLIMANLIAGGILVFAFSMLEVSDSLVLAQKQKFFPITKAIWEFFNRLGDGPYIASAMGVWGMALLTLTLVGASMLMGKRIGMIFRV